MVIERPTAGSWAVAPAGATARPGAAPKRSAPWALSGSRVSIRPRRTAATAGRAAWRPGLAPGDRCAQAGHRHRGTKCGPGRQGDQQGRETRHRCKRWKPWVAGVRKRKLSQRTKSGSRLTVPVLEQLSLQGQQGMADLAADAGALRHGGQVPDQVSPAQLQMADRQWLKAEKRSLTTVPANAAPSSSLAAAAERLRPCRNTDTTGVTMTQSQPRRPSGLPPSALPVGHRFHPRRSPLAAEPPASPAPPAAPGLRSAAREWWRWPRG